MPHAADANAVEKACRPKIRRNLLSHRPMDVQCEASRLILRHVI